MTENDRPLTDAEIAEIAARWQNDLHALSRRGAGWKPPPMRVACGQIDRLLATVREARRRQAEAERAQAEAERLAAKRLQDFKGFVVDVGALSLRYQLGKDAELAA